MKIPWLAFAHIGNAVLTKVLPAIGVLETAGEMFKNLHGADKENGVVDVAKQELAILGKIHGVDLSTDADVDLALRGVIKAVHGFHEIVARKHAAAGG